MSMTLHRDVQESSVCGGQVGSGQMFGTDFWCGSCGAHIGPSESFPWHRVGDDCRSTREPIVKPS